MSEVKKTSPIAEWWVENFVFLFDDYVIFTKAAPKKERRSILP